MHKLSTVLDDYLSFKKLKPKTATQYRALIERCLADWMDQPIEKVTMRMCLDRYHDLTTNQSNRATSDGTGQANLVFRILRALFNFGSAYYGIQLINPVATVRTVGAWCKLEDRTTYLKVEKLAEWYRLLQFLPVVDQHYMLSLALTGTRRAELAQLVWSEVDFKAKIVTIPSYRSKNGREHKIPMSRQFESILKERLIVSKDSAYVFSTPDQPRAPYSANRRSHDRIEAELGSVCYPHALRRTFATIARHQCNIDYALVKRCLNHVSTDITDRYIQKEPEALRASFQAVADFMYFKMRGEKPRVRLNLIS